MVTFDCPAANYAKWHEFRLRIYWNNAQRHRGGQCVRSIDFVVKAGVIRRRLRCA